MIKIRFAEKKDLNQLPWLYRQYHNGDTFIDTYIEGMFLEFDK